MKLEVFGPREYKEYVQSNCKIVQMVDRPRVVRVDDAVVCVYQKQHIMGVYDAEDRFVSESNLMWKKPKRHRKILGNINKKILPYVDADVVFMGDVHWHFGHFLLEHTNRMWAIKDFLGRGMKFLFVYSSVAKQVPQYVYDFMALMGVAPDDVIILDKDARFKTVYVPQSVCNGMCVAREWKQTFDSMATNANADEKYEKIYMSRTALAKRTVFGESAIEDIFRKNGFHIIYPETLPLARQVALVKNARVLAGCAGTALHLAVFMKPGGSVVAIKRNTECADNCESQFLINSVSGLDSVFVWGSVETKKTHHFTSVPQIIGCNQYMCDFFKAQAFDWSQQDCVKNAEFHAYTECLQEYNKKFGGVWCNKIKRFLIRLTACMIPNRTWRGKYRSWMKRRFVGW